MPRALPRTLDNVECVPAKLEVQGLYELTFENGKLIIEEWIVVTGLTQQARHITSENT